MWDQWWVWAVGALILAVGEVLLPSFLLLGFSIGAAVIALLLLVGIPVAGNVYVMVLVFAVISLLSWIVLRRALGIRKGQVKLFDRDINED
ncbi:hypothetical protein HKCCE3408_09680 [Rhodobacterales bacterium HKCCE3408]|nr:hypothetical protein [Rhodobacterales bacterium HKCCE3408]